MTIQDDSSDLVVDDQGRPVAREAEPGRIGTAAYIIGSIGLLSATAVDAIAVLGRHAGFTILGSIELVQAAVVLIASSSMVIATIVGAHASVHIITNQLSKPRRALLERWANLLGAVLFAIMVGGSAWVAVEMWRGFEQTELLGIELRWLRGVWIFAALLIVLLFLRQSVRTRR